MLNALNVHAQLCPKPVLVQYMILICKRASGDLQTTATWIREFIRNHPAYAHDSVVSEEIAHDLVMEMKAIGEVGTGSENSLFLPWVGFFLLSRLLDQYGILTYGGTRCVDLLPTHRRRCW